MGEELLNTTALDGKQGRGMEWDWCQEGTMRGPTEAGMLAWIPQQPIRTGMCLGVLLARLDLRCLDVDHFRYQHLGLDQGSVVGPFCALKAVL